MQDQALLMGTAPIPRLILRFALPSMVGLLANALYNIVDRIFIGHYVGADGLASISIVFPLVLLIVAFASLIGVGSASQISRRLGAQDYAKAQQAFGNGLFASAAFLCLTMPLLMLLMPQIIMLCGATEHIAPITGVYLAICAPAIPLQFLAMVLMNAMRAEGQPQQAMWGMIVGALANVVLDWYFIARLHMGVAGAAWGTVIAQIAAFLWIAFFYVRRRGVLRISLRSMHPSWPVLREMTAVGISPFLVNIFFSLAMVIFNVLLGKYGGEIAISAMGIFFGLDSFFFMPVTGIGEGASPLIGYNYGAGNFDRLRQTVRIAMTLAVAYFVFSAFVAVTWPEALVALFSKGNDELVRVTARSMRIGYACLPFSGVCLISVAVLESLGRAKTAFLFNLIRQLTLIPILLLLPRLWGVDGVWATFPVIDFLGGVAGALLVKAESRRWK